MRSTLDEEIKNKTWYFKNGLRLYYYCGITTKKPAGVSTQKHYFEKVSLEKAVPTTTEYIPLFSLIFNFDKGGLNKSEFRLEGRESILKDLIAGNLEGITNKEYVELPLQVLIFLERKDYMVTIKK